MRHGLRQDDASLRHADQLHGLGGGHGGLQRGRVGHAHVLGRGDDQPPGDEPGVLPRLQHPGEVVHRRVHVRAADGLDEGADHVVVLVAVLVVALDVVVHRLRGVLLRDRDGALPRPAGLARLVQGDAGRGLQHRERPPRVAAGHPHQVVPRVVLEHHGPVEPALLGHGTVQQPDDVVVRERTQREQQRPGEQGCDHREGRVLRGRRHEHDPAVLDARQQRVLLRLGEAVDLVEEQDGGAAVEVAFALGLLHHLPHVLHAGRDGGQLRERAPGGAGDHVGQRRLPDARRPVQDDRARSRGGVRDRARRACAAGSPAA